MKNIKLFEEFKDNDLEDIRDLFIEISDMRYHDYSILNADGSSYKRVTDLIVKKTNVYNI
jgi:phosphoribosyl-ATP pyrophosphohydrolase